MIEASSLVALMVSMFTVLLTVGSLILGRLWSRVDSLQKKVDECEGHRSSLLAEKFALLEKLADRLKP